MLEPVSQLVKASLVPGSTPFLVLGLALGVALLYGRRTHAWGRRWLTSLLLLYVALGMPVVADALRGPRSPGHGSLATKADARGAAIVVVLGNGALTYTDGRSQIPAMTRRTAFNVMEGVRLYALLGHPRLILSGGIVNPESQKQSEAALMADTMERLGVPRTALELEAESRNTYEQSVRIAQLVPRGAAVVVVTTPIHMPRTIQLFEARGLKPVASPSQIDYGPDTASACRVSFRTAPRSARANWRCTSTSHSRTAGRAAGSRAPTRCSDRPRGAGMTSAASRRGFTPQPRATAARVLTARRSTFPVPSTGTASIR